jgi:hypothetical protein
MNRRMERLVPDDAYGSEPADTGERLDAETADAVIAAVDAALERILAEARNGGAA